MGRNYDHHSIRLNEWHRLVAKTVKSEQRLTSYGRKTYKNRLKMTSIFQSLCNVKNLHTTFADDFSESAASLQPVWRLFDFYRPFESLDISISANPCFSIFST